MKKLIAAFFALLIFGASVSADENNSKLSPKEEAAGFESLYSGESALSADLWTGNLDGYPVEDGAFVCRKGGKLMTQKEYADFIFRFEFKLPPRGNNGVGIRCPIDGDAAYNGMEIQILADSYENAEPWQKHGSIYGVVPAKTGALKPDGEWNVEEIIAVGPHITVIVNGQTIVDADITNAKPIHDNPHPGLHNKTGHIGFLGHGDPVALRNVRVKAVSGEDEVQKIKAQ